MLDAMNGHHLEKWLWRISQENVNLSTWKFESKLKLPQVFEI